MLLKKIKQIFLKGVEMSNNVKVKDLGTVQQRKAEKKDWSPVWAQDLEQRGTGLFWCRINPGRSLALARTVWDLIGCIRKEQLS